MGLFSKIEQKVMGGAGKLVKNKIGSTIKNLIKEKRLVFLNAEEVSYTNKEGIKREINLDEMAMVLIDAAGQGNLLSIGITPDDVKNMLVKGWNKKGGKQ